jgi:anti-sigma factor RsiW
MDPLHELRRVIAAAEAAPRDGERFDRAADRVQEAIRASKVSGRAPRWMRMLELARLNRDHSGLAKIAEELEVSAR